MSAGPTPGPWFAVNQGTPEEPLMSVMAARISGKPPRHEVAYCGTGDSDQEMENANARLIAAAPDLLAALKRALFVMESPAFNQKMMNGGGAVDVVRAAITRAEGKAP